VSPCASITRRNLARDEIERLVPRNSTNGSRPLPSREALRAAVEVTAPHGGTAHAARRRPPAFTIDCADGAKDPVRARDGRSATTAPSRVSTWYVPQCVEVRSRHGWLGCPTRGLAATQ
jgi:hypothetical protein